MNVHLVNPSEVSFGTAVITPRWLYVLAAATPQCYGDPVLVDETLAPVDPDRIQPGDLMQASAILASFVYHTANRPEKLPRKPLPEPWPKEMRGK